MPKKFLNGAISTPATPWIGPPPQLNSWHNPSRGPGTGTFALTLNTLYLWPVTSPGLTLKNVQLEVTTLGASGLLRCGFYEHDYTLFRPVLGSPIADLGTQSSATTGAKTFPSSAVLPYGILWFAVVAQTIGCTVRSSTTGHGFSMNLLPGEAPGNNNSRNNFRVTGVVGALPTAGTLASAGDTDPKVFFQRSATV